MTYVSQSFLDMLDLTEKECEGRQWIKKMQIKKVSQLLADWESCVKNNRSWNHRFSIRDKSGNERKILARATPVKNEQGEVTSWVGINLDIDEIASSKEA